jgi:tRNA-dihydrouridine synthase
VTEAILDRALIDPGAGMHAALPFGPMGMASGTDDSTCSMEGDLPLAVQIMGSDAEEIARAAQRVLEMAEQAGFSERAGRLVLDLNLACPVKKVARRKRGGHWLADPDGAIAILASLRASLPETVPCSLKLRRGSQEGDRAESDFFRIFDAAYDLGFAWTTVHARTVEQAYVGPSRWDFLRRLVERNPDRIVFGSGDVWQVEDIGRMLRETGVRAVSVARGAIGNPWIFRQARAMMAGSPVQAPSLREQRQVLERHFAYSCALQGEALACRTMRKFAMRFCQHHPQGQALRPLFAGAGTVEAWQGIFQRHYDPE